MAGCPCQNGRWKSGVSLRVLSVFGSNAARSKYSQTSLLPRPPVIWRVRSRSASGGYERNKSSITSRQSSVTPICAVGTSSSYDCQSRIVAARCPLGNCLHQTRQVSRSNHLLYRETTLETQVGYRERSSEDVLLVSDVCTKTLRKGRAARGLQFCSSTVPVAVPKLLRYQTISTSLGLLKPMVVW